MFNRSGFQRGRVVADSGQGSGLADKRDEQPRSPFQVIPAELFGYLQTLWIPSNSLDTFRLLVPLEGADYCILLNQRSPHYFGFAIRFFEILSKISSQLGLFGLVHSRITSLILISP
jgi:hypothetical protein